MIYIAAPFFKPEQVARVAHVERLLRALRATYYSPRQDGVLKDMAPQKRVMMAEVIFKTNVHWLNHCQAVLAILDDSDTGTVWEMGYAYHARKLLIGWHSKVDATLNVMLRNCLLAHACGELQLRKVLQKYLKDEMLGVFQTMQKRGSVT